MEFFSKYDPSLSLRKLKLQVEGQFYERKSQRIKPSDFVHHLSAFANASGGVVAIGIEDDGIITGVSPENVNAFRQAPFEYIAVPPQINVEEIACNSDEGNPCTILLFHISPCIDRVISLRNGEVYLRVGDQSRKLTPEQYLELEYSKGTKSYESVIVDDASYDDLDPLLIRQYAEMLGLSASSELDILKARGLVKGNHGNLHITAAAVLLFGKIPTQFLPSARIRFLRYEGIKAGVGAYYNVVKDITIEKPLHMALTEAQQLLKSQMRDFHRLGRDGKFVKVPEYPDFAWLEGLVNAVTHRDYSISGDYIRIIMFDDRIEFHSPGKLPSIVTVENIKNTRFSRNPMIARVLSDFGWVRELNEGVRRIYVDMRNFFLDPPVFSEPNGNTVLLVLRNNIAIRSIRLTESSFSSLADALPHLTDLDKEIVYYVANIPKCSPKDLSAFISRSRPTITNHLKKLVNLQILDEHATSANDPTKYYTTHLNK